jgi:flagellar biosynthesis/type III secretory pathway chaperone
MEQVETLCAVLGDETGVCDALLRVLREEQQAVVQLRPDVILSCLEERLALQEQLERLTGRRRALVRALADGLGAGAARSVTALLAFLPPEPQSRVRMRLRALRRALLEARSLERQNDLLIGASAEHVGELMRTLAALVPGVRYDRGAQMTTPGLEQVDRRA